MLAWLPADLPLRSYNHRLFRRCLIGGLAPGGTFAPDLEDAVGHRKQERTEDYFGEAEEHDAAQEGDEDGNHVEANLFADEFRIHEVVDQSDRQNTPPHEDGRLDPVSLPRED